MLIAEDLLLLLTDDEKGTFAVDSSSLDLALAGALLVELAMQGRVRVAGPAEPVRPGRLVVDDPRPQGHQVLDEAVRRVESKTGKKPEQVLSTLKKDLRPVLLAHLAQQGVLRYERDKVLGLFPVDRWPAADRAHEAGVRRDLSECLVAGQPPTPRTAALIGLLSAVDVAHKVVGRDDPSADRRAIKKRAKEIRQQAWATDAVGKAVEAVQTAVIGAMIATTVVITAS